MKLRSFLAVPLIVSIMCSGSLFAENSVKFEVIEDMRNAVKQHVNARLSEEYGDKKLAQDIKVQVSKLDSRLRLQKCEHMTFEMPEARHQTRNLTVKIQCKKPGSWSIYVPVAIEIYADVFVASRNLRRGSVITEDDMKYKRMNTNGLSSGHIKDRRRLLGMELRRHIREGDTFLLSALQNTKIIRKGDSVTLEARNSAIAVVTRGTALNNGARGESIRVRNDQSARVVNGIVMGPGRVEVGFRAAAVNN